ncbi:MAG: Ppx/GppA phosphatase family protein, partial [Microthrixaceae bacterium]
MHPSGIETTPTPSALAAIDIGTNSVHMVVARVVSPERFEVLTRHKEMVRLGSGVGDMVHLETDAIERGVAALRRCQEIARGFDAEVWAVATSAVREAANSDGFLRRAYEEAGVSINVISGVEEARLIQLGVLQSLPVFDKRLLLVDVGGGSTEVLFGTGGDVRYARSLKLGSLRMTQRFFPDGIVEADAVQRCRKFIRSRLAAAVHEAHGLDHDVAVASSGTAESLAVMAIARRGEEAPSDMNAQRLTRKALGKVIDDLASATTTKERLALPAIDSARADILLGGA